MKYIYKNETHSDISNDYMVALGMNNDQIESVLNQVEFEKTKLEKLAAATRKAALNTVEISSYSYDTGIYGLDNIARAIRLADEKGESEDTQTKWRLADNSSRITTLAELREIKSLYDVKYVDVWQQFNDWLDGDKLAAFKVQ